MTQTYEADQTTEQAALTSAKLRTLSAATLFKIVTQHWKKSEYYQTLDAIANLFGCDADWEMDNHARADIRMIMIHLMQSIPHQRLVIQEKMISRLLRPEFKNNFPLDVIEALAQQATDKFTYHLESPEFDFQVLGLVKEKDEHAPGKYEYVLRHQPGGRHTIELNTSVHLLKTQLFEAIRGIKDKALQIDALTQAKSEDTFLGQLFYIQRWFPKAEETFFGKLFDIQRLFPKPSIASGTLKQIETLLQRVTTEKAIAAIAPVETSVSVGFPSQASPTNRLQQPSNSTFFNNKHWIEHDANVIQTIMSPKADDQLVKESLTRSRSESADDVWEILNTMDVDKEREKNFATTGTYDATNRRMSR